MQSVTVIIFDPVGLHARPASMLVKTASGFRSTITLFVGEKRANAKSILQVLALQARQGMEVRIETEGEDEQAAAQALARLVGEGGEGEPPPA